MMFVQILCSLLFVPSKARFHRIIVDALIQLVNLSFLTISLTYSLPETSRSPSSTNDTQLLLVARHLTDCFTPARKQTLKQMLIMQLDRLLLTQRRHLDFFDYCLHSGGLRSLIY